MKLTFHIWRQKDRTTRGRMERYQSDQMNPDMSMLEALDVLNEELILRGEEPVAFEHDCREGICGSCGFMINGVAHGPLEKTTVCQLSLRHFRDGEDLYLEPWRARAFPVLRDLMVDRSPFDRIVAAGGYISVPAGSAPDGNSIPVPKDDAERSMDAAACIGCGACVAACPNASASLFTGAKISHLGLLPQGQPERDHSRATHGASNEYRIVRPMHQHRRVRGGLSKGDFPRSDQPDERGFYSGELEEVAEDILVQKHSHAILASSESFASSSAFTAISRETVGNWRRNSLQRMATFQIVDEILKRNPCTAKARCSRS